ASEVETHRELNLPARAQTDGTLHGLAQQAEGRAGCRLREWLSRLEEVRADTDGLGESRGRIREVRVIEEIEHLGTELEICRFGEPEALDEDHIELRKIRSFERVARQIAVSARLGNREGRRVEVIAVVIEVGAHA